MANSVINQEGEGIILILNGPSSSGKTSIQKAFQKKSDHLFLRIGIDSFFDELLPEPDISRLQEEKRFDQKTSLGEYIRGITLEEDATGAPIIPLHIGPAGDRVMRGMHRSMATYAKAGNNLIVDYILYKAEYLDDLISSLKGRKVYWIGVFAPLDIIEQREKARGTSPAGHARSHYQSCHQNVSYDLELNTEKTTPEELAEEILNFIYLKGEAGE
jgi:chloramphenicol 3-O phosphotransferase